MMRSRTTRRRTAAGVLATSLTLALVAACSSGGSGDEATTPSGGSSSDAPSTAPVPDHPLQFFLSGDASQGGAFQKMADKYKEQTGVEIQIVDIANADLPTKIKEAAQANDLPAFASVGSIDPTWKDLTVDLSSITTGSDIDPALTVADQSSGKVLGIATDFTAVGMFINKSLFDEAGVAYPKTDAESWTWDQFVDKVNEVKAKTGTTYGMVMDKSSHREKAFLYEFGSDWFRPTGDGGKFETNDATKTAFEYFKKLNDDKFMPRSVWLSGGDPAALFKSGDVVAYMSGSWQIAGFQTDIANFEWASVPLPQQNVRATNYGAAGFATVFEGPDQDAAVAFLKWLYTPDNYQEFATYRGALPVIKGMTVDHPTNADAFQLYTDEVANSPEIVGQVYQDSTAYQVAGVTTDGDPARDELVKYLNDEEDVDTAINNILAAYDDQLGPLP